jgi:predicted GNAT superfamily acetyltransferase
MIGIALAFPARSDHGWILWSHMTGVHRDYQAQGIGFELKQRQREWALANGYDEIRWTFDPLQRGNANFNLHLLGVTACQYHVNFYGVMADEINKADIPSDRIEAIWRLRETHAETQNGADRPIPFLLKDTGSLEIVALDETISEYLVQIPNTLPRDPEMLSAWRFALRQALMSAFQQGYHAVDFTNANAYLLRHL